jgi:hypothetical protein
MSNLDVAFTILATVGTLINDQGEFKTKTDISDAVKDPKEYAEIAREKREAEYVTTNVQYSLNVDKN